MSRLLARCGWKKNSHTDVYNVEFQNLEDSENCERPTTNPWNITLRSLICLHASVLLWIGIWDNLTYTGVGAYWPEESVERELIWLGIGTTLLIVFDTFHTNALIPGDLGGSISWFWYQRTEGFWLWLRALCCYFAQVIFTVALYNLFSYDITDVLPTTVLRDGMYLFIGVTLSVVINCFYSYLEMASKHGWAEPISAELTARSYQDSPEIDHCSPKDDLISDVNLNKASEIQEEKQPYEGRECIPYAPKKDLTKDTLEFHGLCGESQYDASLGLQSPHGIITLIIAAVSWVAQVWIWVGMDNCMEIHIWAVLRSSIISRVLHNILNVIIGIVVMQLTGTLPYWASVLFRGGPPNKVCFPIPDERPSGKVLVRLLIRDVFSNLAFYIHLSGFWYLIDEDIGLKMSTQRNCWLTVIGFVVLLVTGSFQNEAL